MKNLEEVRDWMLEFLKAELFSIGKSEFTFGTMVFIILAVTVLFYISKKIKKLLVGKIFPRYQMDIGVSDSFGTIVHYAIITIGLVVIVQSAGIDITTFGILLGALGFGIGFGLQNIANNFISGIIILFERPVKVGYRVEVNDVAGNIVKISARATTVITNDNIAIIVPNSEFINSTVINWSYDNRRVRFNFPVGVSYKENPKRIRDLLIEVANAHSGVLKDPTPDVLFDAFGDSSLDFNLRVWSTEFSDRPKVLKSQLYYAIFEKFKEHGIEIPFPQRDIHVRDWVKMEAESKESAAIRDL